MTADLPVGTIICVDDPGLFNGVEKRLTCSPVSHAIIYVGAGQVVQAQARGAVISPLSGFAGRPQCNNAPQAAALGPTVANSIRAHALGFAERKVGYGFLDIASLFLIHTFGWHWGWLERRVARQDRLICSQLVALAWAQAGVPLPTGRHLIQDVTPGDLEWMIATRAWER